jgi:sodium/proline symporter
MIVGALTVIVWKELEGGIFEIFELLPGFILSWIAIVIFSKYGTSNPDSIAKKFDEVQSRLKN